MQLSAGTVRSDAQESDSRAKKVRQPEGGDGPKHVAIIMDGNGRWAQLRSRPRAWGHRKGAESVREVVRAAPELGIEILTLYAFSDENWGRPAHEVEVIMGLLNSYILRERDELDRNNVRFRAIGKLERLPAKSQQLVEDVQTQLAGNTGLQLNVALSYGARSELTAACQAIAKRVQEGRLAAEEITAEDIAENLWTAGQRDPDLLIRTSGEQRVSNFLLWQMAYTEMWFTDTLWPDFRRGHLAEGIEHFRQRERRFGLASVSPA